MNFNPDEPIYLQLARILTQEILSGRLPAGTKLTERWIAQEYKMARQSVRNALHLLSAQGLVHRISPRRIVVADVEVDQRRHPGVPIILVRDRRYPLADASIPDIWYGEIRAGIRAAAKDMGCRMHEEALADPFKVPLKEYVAPRPGEVGGVVLCGTYDEQYIEMFRSERVPLVVVDYWAHNLMTDCVCVAVEDRGLRDHRPAGQQGALLASGSWLWADPAARGRRPTNTIRTSTGCWSTSVRASRDRHLELRDEWCLLVPDGQQLAQAVQGYLSMQRRPTALLCFCPSGSGGGTADRHEARLTMPGRLFAGHSRCRTHRGTGGRRVRD